MRIQAIDSNGPVFDATGEPGFEFEDERFEVLDEFVKRNSSTIAGVRFGAKDAVEPLAFLVSQLAYLENKSFEKQGVPEQWEEMLKGCIDYSAGEWATTVEYETTGSSGQGQPISPAADDLPMADVATNRKSMRIQHGGIGYTYTNQELRTAARFNRPLPMAKQMAAIKGYRLHMNKVALYGEAASNFLGLFNNTGVTTVNRPSAAVWDAATPATILSDLNAGIMAVWNASANNTYPNVIAIAPTSFGLLLKARSDNSDKTILTYLKENNIYTQQTGRPLTIVPGFGLDTAGIGPSKRAVFFNNEDDNIVLHIPMPIRFGAPQLQVLRTLVPAEYRYGGTEIRRIKTAYNMDGL
jgi:hypothetical protein